jgi:hypothetical protein
MDFFVFVSLYKATHNYSKKKGYPTILKYPQGHLYQHNFAI